MTWGIGIGDELTIRGGEAMKQILGEADSICVRDQPSAARLGQIGIRKKVTLTADPALLLPEGLPTHVSHHSVNSPPKVFVFVRHWYVSENRIRDLTKWRKFEGSLAACLDSLISERSAEVCFIPMRIKDPVDDDRVVAREISQIMAKGKTVKIVDQTVSSSELVHLIAQGDLIIGMRLHSLITAATMGVPSIAINYHPKVRSFMESIGGGEWVFEIGDPDGSSQLLNAAREVLSGRYPREEVLAEVDKLRALAHLNTSIAAKLLHDDSFARGRFRRVIHAIPILASRTIEAVRKHD
jgi:polysaccharide pyruvyl transferase WcaK-like protein